MSQQGENKVRMCGISYALNNGKDVPIKLALRFNFVKSHSKEWLFNLAETNKTLSSIRFCSQNRPQR
ncbi:hypothetical protein ACROAK_04795 [Shewanella oncorhynchi]|uniref:hypothetical protein n=1 Tax=Shewanella oncorhynchi TaxID=2726434 RepID=UPI003D79E58A